MQVMILAYMILNIVYLFYVMYSLIDSKIVRVDFSKH